MASNKPSNTTGLVYLVGAGPGDPGLITLNGKDALAACDVVVYDRLAHPRLLRHCRPDAERIYVGKQAARHTMKQEEINALLVERGQAGQVVCRLKGGDPFVFGRGGEEAEALADAGVPFVVVPGVTSGIAAPAYAGIPVTHRKLCSAFGIITGHEDPTKPESALRWDALAQGLDTYAFYMGVERLASVTGQLLAHGKDPDTPVALIRWGTWTKQEVLTATLATIADRAREANFQPPAMILVGEVVRLREKLRWFDNRPLFGKTVVVTRAREQASEMVERLTQAGADAWEFPAIRIEPLDTPIPWDALPANDWLLFTSPNTVRLFFERLQAEGQDIRALGMAKIGSVGPTTTAALEEKGLRVAFQPQRETSEDMLREFPVDPNGLRIFLARAEEAPEVLPDGLRGRGAAVDVLPLYRTVAEAGEDADDLRRAFEEGEIDAVTFTSSSTVRNFFAAVREVKMEGVTVACFGPKTAETAREHGLDVHIMPESRTLSAFVETLIQHYAPAAPDEDSSPP
ncbi:MAG: uroporphyrinogen-III C-methyltransferase [Armatimonadetes bacterium]|nr:uroporphyrinogen-III C-methyltransferase [Armatimonadota bacterium]